MKKLYDFSTKYDIDLKASRRLKVNNPPSGKFGPLLTVCSVSSSNHHLTPKYCTGCTQKIMENIFGKLLNILENIFTFKLLISTSFGSFKDLFIVDF